MSKRAARYDVAVMFIGAVAFGGLHLLWIADALVVLPEALFPTLPVILSLVGSLLLAVGIGGVHRKQRAPTGVLGGVGYWVLLGGLLAYALTVFVLVSSAFSVLTPVSWLMVGVGAIVYGAATLRAEVLARWAAWLLAAGPFGGILIGSVVYLLGGDSVGLIYLGHVSIAVGLAGLAFSVAAVPDPEDDASTRVTISVRPIPPPSMQPAPRPNPGPPAITPEPPASDAPPPS